MAQLDTLKTMLDIAASDTSKDGLLIIHLDMATAFIADKRNSYDEESGDPVLESKYEFIQLMLATESYTKSGAEGERSHSESGIGRSYENGSAYSASTVAMIVPKVRVIDIENATTE